PDGKFTSGNELLYHHLVVEFRRFLDGIPERADLPNDREPYGRPLLARLYDYRQPKFPLDLSSEAIDSRFPTCPERSEGSPDSRDWRHAPIRRRNSRCPKQMLRQILVHRQRAGAVTAPRIRDTGEIEQRLQRPVLPLAPMKREKHHIGPR